MKNFTKFSLSTIALGALLFAAGCKSEKNQLKDGVTLEVSSGIRGLRAVDNTWEAGDAIGVFSSTLTASNVKFTTTDASTAANFSTAAPVKIADGTEQHAVQAYYPYADDVADALTIALPVEKPVLWAEANVTYANPVAALNFSHKLAQLQITIQGSELGDAMTTAGTASIKGVKNSAKMAIATGEVTTEATTADLDFAISDYDNAAKTFVAKLYLLPGENIEGKEVIVTVGANTYTVPLTAGTTTSNIKSGKRYKYTFNLKPATKPEVDMTSEGATITEVTEEVIDPVDATPNEETATTQDIVVDTSTATVAAAGGNATVNVTVADTQDYTVSSNQAWATVSPAKGTGSGVVTITASENTDAQERTATITIASTGHPSVTVTLTQEAAASTPATGAVAIYPDGFADFLTTGTVSGVTSEIVAGAGKNGGDAIKLSGVCTKNSYTVPLTAPTPFQANPKQISFWIKGTSSTKSITVVRKLYNTGMAYNLGDLTADVTLEEAANNYAGSINTSGTWVKVTLNTSAMLESMAEGEELFNFKCGSGAEYDILISDIEAIY